LRQRRSTLCAVVALARARRQKPLGLTGRFSLAAHCLLSAGEPQGRRGAQTMDQAQAVMDTLFSEGQSGLKVVLFVIVGLGLLALAFWLLRQFGGGRVISGATRGRQPRLAVIDQAIVDSRRRLVLIRRDNVEHLLIIGGPSDVVVEQNIVRAATALRETGPPRPPAMPRAPRRGDSLWPLQPQPPPTGAPS